MRERARTGTLLFQYMADLKYDQVSQAVFEILGIYPEHILMLTRLSWHFTSCSFGMLMFTAVRYGYQRDCTTLWLSWSYYSCSKCQEKSKLSVTGHVFQ